MIGLYISLILLALSLVLGLILALLRGAFSWLSAFFHNPLGVLTGTVLVVSILGSILGIIMHVAAVKDVKQGGWVGNVTMIWNGIHGQGVKPSEVPEVWFIFACMFICPIVLILFLLFVLVMSIINKVEEARAERGRLLQEQVLAQAQVDRQEAARQKAQADRHEVDGILTTIREHSGHFGAADRILCNRLVTVVTSNPDAFTTDMLNMASAIEAAMKLGPVKGDKMISAAVGAQASPSNAN